MIPLLLAAVAAGPLQYPQIEGVTFTDKRHETVAFVGHRHPPYEKSELIIAGQVAGVLRELLTIRANGDILLRGKRIGHDPELGEAVQHQFWKYP